jgi:FtsH-binding integral membrane protein
METMKILSIFNQVLAFSLEMLMLYGIGSWGFQQGKNVLFKWLIAIALLAVAVVLWGIFAAPKSEYRLKMPGRALFQVAMFSSAAVCMYKQNKVDLAVGFTIGFVVSVLIEGFMGEE